MAYERVPLEDFVSVFSSTSTEISSVALNGHVVSVSDEFFAAASQLLEVAPAPSLKGQFGPNGALFSGWESRRHNPAYDWCIIKLGAPSGYIVGFDVDTAHFSGNEAPEVSIQAVFREQGQHVSEVDEDWTEILPKVSLGPSSRHLFKIPQTTAAYTHVKLNMYPDGGIARFRVYGLVAPIFPKDPSELIDLAYVLSGGRVVAVSDQHFGVGPNLLLPGRGKDMGDGWETKRSRGAEHKDWVIIKLGAPGILESAEIDTAHFKGNFPESCELHGTVSSNLIPEDAEWDLLLPRVKLGPHRQHFFQLAPPEGSKSKPYTHVRVTIYPDGGIKRVRILGRRSSDSASSSADIAGLTTVLSSATLTSAFPATTPSRPTVSIPALPLTREAFAPYGDVIQAYEDATAAPKGIKVTSANQGTAFKFHNLSSVISSYPSDTTPSTGPPRVSVFRSTPPKAQGEGKAVSGGEWDVRLLERHAATNQVFIPMGSGKLEGLGVGGDDAIKGEAGKAYLVVVALNGADDKPDASTLRGFLASTSQGIAYGTGVWHHPMISLEHTIDFTCIETQVGTPDHKVDCELIELPSGVENPQYLVRIPKF